MCIVAAHRDRMSLSKKRQNVVPCGARCYRGSSMNGTGNNDKGRSLYQTCIFDLVNKRIREKQCFLNLSCSLCSLLKCVYHAQKFFSLFPVPFILDPLYLMERRAYTTTQTVHCTCICVLLFNAPIDKLMYTIHTRCFSIFYLIC